ncbi:hypothetical protein [Phaeobacter sp. NW0010-22]|uniref:DUF6950 family protein n=1 Tax=Phaeobacter sp. NW0010-22 TaxID=3135907 RepID=UPI00310648DD
MTPLYQELHRWSALPFIWGESDCMLCLADWVQRVRGVDPAAHIRGTYDSRGGCQRETGFLRDPVAAVEGCLGTIGGLERVGDPRTGDVAVIMVRDAEGRVSPCGAVWLGTAWGFKGPHSTTTLHPRAVQEVLAIWSVDYET